MSAFADLVPITPAIRSNQGAYREDPILAKTRRPVTVRSFFDRQAGLTRRTLANVRSGLNVSCGGSVLRAARCSVRLALLLALFAISGITPAVAHDFIWKQYLAGERAIADLQTARDQVLASPTVSTETKQAAQAYVATAFVWDKTTFSVCFWQTDNPTLLQGIKDQADLWSEGTRIRFDFGIGGFRKCNDERSADIRVTVGSVPVNYYAVNDRPAIGWDFSEYGNLASKVAAKVSMSLVRVPRYLTLSDSLDFNFDVAHEFGHALGLMHEFQRIDCTQFLAKKQTVMQVYGFKTDADYDLFVQNLKQISSSDTTLLPQELFNLNRDSIMFYNFPQNIWNTDTNNRCARPTPVQHPNQSDLAAINYFYGTPAGIAAVSPQAPAALNQPPAAAPPPATMPAARGGGITPNAAQLGQVLEPEKTQLAPAPNNTSGRLTKNEAKKVLEDAKAAHLRAASDGGTPTPRGGGGGGGAQQAQQNLSAASTIKNLLNAFDRATSRNQR